MRKREWFDIQNKGNEAEIYIYAEIGESFWSESVSASDFKHQLMALKGSVTNIKVRINSPGGSVFDGVAIYNLLRSFPASIETQIDGMAASIASVIALAGDKITIAENGMMMIHDPWMFVIGDAAEMRKAADLLDKVKAATAETYIQRTLMDENTVYKKMAEETWFTAQEAIEVGLAHEVTQPVKIAACDSRLLLNFKNTPEPYKKVEQKAAEPSCAEISIAKSSEPDSSPENPDNRWKIQIAKQRLRLLN